MAVAVEVAVVERDVVGVELVVGVVVADEVGLAVGLDVELVVWLDVTVVTTHSEFKVPSIYLSTASFR